MAITMELKLFGPGMTGLHRVGLAGLYMTLYSFEESGKSIDGLSWELKPDRVWLNWQEVSIKSAFEGLVKESFKLDKEGFFRFPGLEINCPPSDEQKHHLYNALLNTFLQFGPHRTNDTKRVLSYQIDEKNIRIKDFMPVISYRHQSAVKDFIGRNGFNATIDVAGWLFPGGGQRHVAHNNSKLSEPLEMALCLLFAPIGSIFFQISSKVVGRKARGAILLPAVHNLEEYAETRQIIASQGIIEMTASGSSDAALRLLALLRAQGLANDMRREIKADVECRLITFGIVSWNEKQKSRTMTRSIVSGEIKGMENYCHAYAIFKNRLQLIKAKVSRTGQITEPERSFVATYTMREIIAENIAVGNPWFKNFAEHFAHKELRKHILYERKELHEMVCKASYEHEMERLFIAACHEAWRRQLGKLGERARRENILFSTIVGRESEKLRMSFSRCRNARDLRETVIDFWARSGSVKILQESWGEILPMFDEHNWRTAKDLALLALASYKPANSEEEEALTTVQDNETEGQNQ